MSISRFNDGNKFQYSSQLTMRGMKIEVAGDAVIRKSTGKRPNSHGRYRRLSESSLAIKLPFASSQKDALANFPSPEAGLPKRLMHQRVNAQAHAPKMNEAANGWITGKISQYQQARALPSLMGAKLPAVDKSVVILHEAHNQDVQALHASPLQEVEKRQSKLLGEVYETEDKFVGQQARVIEGLCEIVIPYYAARGDKKRVAFLNKVVAHTQSLIDNSFVNNAAYSQLPTEFFDENNLKFNRFFDGLCALAANYKEFMACINNLPLDEKAALDHAVKTDSDKNDFKGLAITAPQRAPRYELLLRDYQKVEDARADLIQAERDLSAANAAKLVGKKLNEQEIKMQDVSLKKRTLFGKLRRLLTKL